MQYMLLINFDETGMPANADTSRMSPAYTAYTEAMQKAGVLIGGDRLVSTKAAKRVSIRDGKAVVLDGPFADTVEQLGGYYIIDVPTIDEAVQWAGKCPTAETGTIEVRPVWQYAD